MLTAVVFLDFDFGSDWLSDSRGAELSAEYKVLAILELSIVEVGFEIEKESGVELEVADCSWE